MCLNVLTDMMKHNNYLLHIMLKSRDAVGFESRLIFWSFIVMEDAGLGCIDVVRLTNE